MTNLTFKKNISI